MVKAVQGYGLVKDGGVAAGAGAPRTAQVAEAVAWFDRSHLSYTHSLFTLRLGEGYLRQGELLQARRLFAEVLATSREAGYRQLEGVAERFLGESMAVEHPTAA